MIHASESGHWYSRDGSPVYEVTGKNGRVRPTNLRDAREKFLVPSFSGVKSLLSAPGLTHWMIQQGILSALTLPRLDDESLDAFAERAMKDSREQSRKAAEKGTEIHAAIQGYFEGKDPGEMWPHVKAVRDALNSRFGEVRWIAEQSFAHPSGCGGKVDLYHNGRGQIVLDVKTKDVINPDKALVYDEHFMQLAFYRVGLLMPSALCANVFVSVSKPGEVLIVEHDQSDLLRGYSMFMALLQLWKAKNNYDPSFEALEVA